MNSKILIVLVCGLLFIPILTVVGNDTKGIDINKKDKSTYTNPPPVTISIGKYSIMGFKIVIENIWGSTLNSLDVGYEITGGFMIRGDSWSGHLYKLENNQEYVIPVCFWPPNQTAPLSPMGFGPIEIKAYVDIPNFDIIYESRNAYLIWFFVFL